MRVRVGFYNVTILALLMVSVSTVGQQASSNPTPSKVAFIISENFNMIDFAGPWEVFQDTVKVAPGGSTKDGEAMFELYTVAETTAPVHSTGGALMTPSFSFSNAPRPDIVVIGAQPSNSPALLDWLTKQHAQGATMMSVCTGARKLALSGLVDGLPATTHHEFLADFQTAYPKVKWQPTQRFVKATDTIYSAGGLTSGIDLALHVVAERAGNDVATRTAKWMEYESDGWKTGASSAGLKKDTPAATR